MAPSTVACYQNVALASFLSAKREELRQPGSGHDSGKLDTVFHQAYKSVCLYKDPILSLQQARKVRGIGNWLLTILKSEFFQEEDDTQQPVDDGPARRAKAPRRYLPQKNSAPYAILITLHRSTVQGEKDFMFKQELIEAADCSGLCTKPIEPGRGSGATGRFGDSTRDWYAGWSSMKTLISKGLVVKSNCPARYKLTSEGCKVAEECMGRSGLEVRQASQNPLPSAPPPSAEVEVIEPPSNGRTRVGVGSTKRPRGAVALGAAYTSQPSSADVEVIEPPSNARTKVNVVSTRRSRGAVALGAAHTSEPSSKEAECTNLCSSSRLASENMDTPDFIKLRAMGFKEEDIKKALSKAKAITISESLWEVAFDYLLEEVASNAKGQDNHSGHLATPSPPVETANKSVLLRPCSSGLTRPQVPSLRTGEPAASDRTVDYTNSNSLDTPPLENGESFKDLYDVILILDDREQYAREGTNYARKFAERLMGMYNVEVAVRHLPVGDATWIARHKLSRAEYMLDFIVERKRVDDLWTSIKDKRYKDQKLRLKRCGIKRLIYLIEGDPNLTDATEALKTAAFSTELADGFDVQRTIDTHETMKRYGELTEAITARYARECNTSGVVTGGCLTFSDFLNHCKDLDKERVSDVFAVQLTQARLVTEDVALSILEKYPTLAALAHAYSALEGNLSAQVDMLKGLPIRNKKRAISSAISKSVYNFIWAPSPVQ